MQVGDYTVLAPLGEGGMGIVHLARHPDGRRVALKVLRPHIVGDDEARARLAREVTSLQRVRSPWVAEMLDADPWAEVPYVVTRYVPGLSLHHHVAEEGPVEGADLLWLAGCLAEGVAAVHAADVLHRDVKPANVLMEGRTPILIDFGLARVADDPRLTQTGWLLGTPGYLAPEVLYGDDPTPAVDVHAWAATVAWAATGRGPYGRGPSMAIMDRTRRGQHDLTGMSGPLADVVGAALDPDPLVRPTFGELLAWLRPLSTRPDLPPVPPPVAAAGEEDDDFTLPLAIAAAAPVVPAPSPRPAAPAPPTLTGPDPTPTTEPEADAAPPWTRSMPADGAARQPAAVAQWEWEWDERQLAPQHVGWLERFRRGVMVAFGGVVVGAALAAAPWLTAVAIATGVWLLRSTSLAASATAQRRTLRGRKWYDAPRFLLTTPWHVLRGVTGTVLLVLWSAGLGLAAGLICYALALGTPVTLFVSGTVLGTALWSGPGAGRFRGPVSRVVYPAARRPLTWMIWCVVLLAVAALLGVAVTANGVAWVPADGAPFGLG